MFMKNATCIPMSSVEVLKYCLCAMPSQSLHIYFSLLDLAVHNTNNCLVVCLPSIALPKDLGFLAAGGLFSGFGGPYRS